MSIKDKPQPQDYASLLADKSAKLTRLLAPFCPPSSPVETQLDVFASAVSHFRMRAEFGVWHEGFGQDSDCYYTMMLPSGSQANAGRRKQRTRIDTFTIACQPINELMPKLLAAVKQNNILKHKLFQVEFLATLSGEMLVTLIYHKPLCDEWLAAAKPLEAELGCHIIGRARKQKLVLSQDFVVEKLKVNGKIFTYKQFEGGFTQPNATICEHMLTWATAQCSKNNHETDLLELYCGNGNFTIPLAQYFKNVLATEISKTSVMAAKWNIETNKANNIKIARLSASELTQALQGKRVFRRLLQADINLADYKFSTVFVDPPRAGIDDDTLKLISGFNSIIYISCNPDTLASNLETLCQTHVITACALFDQFPYTHHIEAGVMLNKRVA